MRTLATLSFSFGAGVLLSLLLPLEGWQLYAAGGLALLGLVLIFLRNRWRYGRHAVVIAFALAVSLLYCVGYTHYVVQPVLDRCDTDGPFAGTVCAYPVPTTYGAKVTIQLDGTAAKAVYYGEETLLTARPGDHLEGTATWKDASRGHEEVITTFTSRGVYALLYGQGEATVTAGEETNLRYLPLRLCHRFQEQIGAIWGEGNVGAMVSGILTGDLAALPDEDYTAMKEAGLAHLFAVSGMNCAFLVSLLGFFLPARRRRLGAAVTIAALLFYMAMVGLTPSVVRACIMQIFLLLAPLFLRDSDAPTSLGAALLVILLCNPYAAMSVSLQLSFGATLGLVLFAPKLYGAMMNCVRGKNRFLRRIASFLFANLAATAGALIFTAPLTAYYFNMFSLISPISNLLVVPVVGWGFMAAFLITLMGFVSLPAATVLGVGVAWLMRYALWITHLLADIPYHAVYFTSHTLRYWLACVYAMLLVCAISRERNRKYIYCAALSVLVLAFGLYAERRTFESGVMTLTAYDVGQGLSVSVHGGTTALIDCGSSNSYIHAGTVAADALATAGVDELEAVVVTHYHADHTNGFSDIFHRLQVNKLYLPNMDDEFGVRERLIDMAERQGTEVIFVETVTEVPLGTVVLTLYPPVGEGALNEQGLSICAAAGDFEVIITGDMAGTTEEALIERYRLPDCEVLVVGHHGSSGSTSREFLEAIRPETAIISVGDNSYGHPTQEVLLRLGVEGAEVYRTDNAGHIRVKVTGGDDHGVE